MARRNLSCLSAWPSSAPKAITPQQFLDWAKTDVKGGDARCLANALSNAKRAAHAQIDRILRGLRVDLSSDWPKTPDTDTKLKALGLAGAPDLNVARALTKRRNDLEHDYLLTPQNQIRADVEAAGMWLDKIRKWNQPSVLVGGLEFRNVGVHCSSKPGRPRYHLSGDFQSPTTIWHFWDAKRLLRKVDASGNESVTPYSDISWKDLVRQQASLVASKNCQHVNGEMATRLVRAYIGWRKGIRSAEFSIRSRKN